MRSCTSRSVASSSPCGVMPAAHRARERWAGFPAYQETRRSTDRSVDSSATTGREANLDILPFLADDRWDEPAVVRVAH